MFVIIVIRGGVPADNEIRGILEGDQHHIQRTGRDPGRIRPGRMNGMRPKRWQEYHPEERAIHRLVPSAVWAYGSLGLGLFLATYGGLSGCEKSKELARGAFRPVGQIVGDQYSHESLDVEIGAGVGIASIVYSLVATAVHLGDDSLVDDALKVSQLLSEDRVKADKYLDVISGTAGTILGLRVLYDMTQDGDVLRKMILCGEHLLQSRMPAHKGKRPRAWATLGGELNSGFAHGAAGISYALSRLFEVTGRESYLQAALEGVDYEETLFVSKLGNWRDMRDVSADREAVNVVWGWCNGAPGIVLGRLGMRHLLGNDGLDEQLTDVLSTIVGQSAVGPDDLCCGRIGRTETLLTASEQLKDEKWRDAAIDLATSTLDGARKRGDFEFNYQMERGSFCPSLFKGTAGIGYQLLRLLYPSEVRCALLWQ